MAGPSSATAADGAPQGCATQTVEPLLGRQVPAGAYRPRPRGWWCKADAPIEGARAASQKGRRVPRHR
jgi:hypothetical protein